MAGDAVRSLYAGLQATRDVAATTSMKCVPLNDVGHKLNRVRKETNEYFGTLCRARKSMRGGEYDTLDLKSDVYYDWQVNLLASALKMPVTANYAGETTVKNHTMIEAINAPLLTIQFDDGVQWWQILNAVVGQVKYMMPEAGPPTVEFTVMGDPAQPIAAPTVIPLALASYAGPIDWPQLLVRVGVGQVVDITVTNGGSAYTTAPAVSFTGGGGGSGATAIAIITGAVVTAVQILTVGSGYTSAPSVVFTGGGGTLAAATASVGGVADIMSGSLTINRNRKPRFPSRRNSSPKRFVEGNVKIDFEVMPDYTADNGSLFKLYRRNGNNQTFPSIQWEWANVNVALGVVPTNPTLLLTVPNPIVLTGDHDVTKQPTETPIKGIGGYDPTVGGGVQIVATNDIAAYTAS